jgi:hypothetical protein
MWISQLTLREKENGRWGKRFKGLGVQGRKKGRNAKQ